MQCSYHLAINWDSMSGLSMHLFLQHSCKLSLSLGDLLGQHERFEYAAVFLTLTCKVSLSLGDSLGRHERFEYAAIFLILSRKVSLSHGDSQESMQLYNCPAM